MTIRHTRFAINDFKTQKHKINALEQERIVFKNELEKSRYFKETFKANKEKPKTNYNTFRTYDSGWEAVDLVQLDGTGDVELERVTPIKIWKVPFYHIPEEYIPFMDIKILFKYYEIDSYLLARADKSNYFEISGSTTILHASITFPRRITLAFNNVEAKLLVTFLYPYNLE